VDHSQVRRRPGGIGQGNLIPGANKVAKDGVDLLDLPLVPVPPGQFHRFIHRGPVGDAIEKKDLVCAEPEGVSQIDRK